MQTRTVLAGGKKKIINLSATETKLDPTLESLIL